MRRMSPNAPKTPIRSIRIPDALWADIQAKADREGVTASDAVRDLLEQWVHGDVKMRPRED